MPRSCHSLSLLDDWIDCVDAIDGKSFFDWNDEERDLPQALRSDSVFPFGAKGSFLRNTLQKWPSQKKPPLPVVGMMCAILILARFLLLRETRKIR